MAVLVASGLRKELSGEPLFDGVSFTLRRRDRLALAGPNGAGKTTLLRMLVGETSITAGEVSLAKGTRVALHDQRPPRDQGLTLREYALSGAADLVAIEQELRRLEEAMAGGDHAAQTLRRYSDAQARLEHAGGWGWRDRAAATLRGLGFRDDDLDRRLETFSGGELTRASLGRALTADPDLLLLDEPTNHLDVESLEWLERELTTRDTAVVLVAHDRWFLEAVTTGVLELGGPKPFFFDGTWSAWRMEKAARASAMATTVDRVSVDIERLQRFVDRFRAKKNKAKQAQAKLTQIQRLREGASLREAGARGAHGASSLARVRVPQAGPLRPDRARGDRARRLGRRQGAPPRSGASCSSAESTSRSWGRTAPGRPPCSRPCSASEQPDAGSCKLGHGVVPAYFSQHDAELPKTGTVLDAAVAGTGLPRPQAQSLLGKFLFTRLGGAREAGRPSSRVASVAGSRSR